MSDVKEDEPGEPELAELAGMRAQVRIALNILSNVDASLRQRAETGRMVMRPPRYEEMADRLFEGTRVVAEISDRLGVACNDKIHEINRKMGYED